MQQNGIVLISRLFSRMEKDFSRLVCVRFLEKFRSRKIRENALGRGSQTEEIIARSKIGGIQKGAKSSWSSKGFKVEAPQSFWWHFPLYTGRGKILRRYNFEAP